MKKSKKNAVFNSEHQPIFRPSFNSDSLKNKLLKWSSVLNEVNENRLFVSLWMILVRGENINGFTKLGNSINYYVATQTHCLWLQQWQAKDNTTGIILGKRSIKTLKLLNLKTNQHCWMTDYHRCFVIQHRWTTKQRWWFGNGCRLEKITNQIHGQKTFA